MRFTLRPFLAFKFLVFLAFLLGTGQAFAQVPDTTYQKPQLNQGTMPETPTQVIVTPPDKAQVKTKEKVKTKNDTPPVISDQPVYKNRFFTGGSGSLSFGTYTFIQIAPIFGYQVTEKFAVGTGLSYIYVDIPGFKGNLIGGKLFAQAMVYKTFFAHAEYELVDFRDNFPVVPVGGGYRQMFSEKGGMDLMVLFDLNQNTRSFYTNPIIRAGFIFYLK